eukprot:m.66276 g.66276  ORF g.66276 m.66276 type:complete len:56 (+) comp35376_c0_seq5:126-293(+)
MHCTGLDREGQIEKDKEAKTRFFAPNWLLIVQNKGGNLKRRIQENRNSHTPIPSR